MRTNDYGCHGEVWSVRSGRDLGRAIAGIRKKSGLRQVDLAERARIDRQYLITLEAGEATLAIERALRVLRRMGAEVTICWDGQDDKKG